MASKEMKAAWALPFTAADAVAITSMDDATRAIVERYRRASLSTLAGNLVDVAFGQGGMVGERVIEAESELALGSHRMSKYVKRCLECRQVRGVSAFRVIRGEHLRSDCCRWCEERSGLLRKMQQSANNSVAALRQQESELEKKLLKVRMAIRVKQLEAGSISHERMVG